VVSDDLVGVAGVDVDAEANDFGGGNASGTQMINADGVLGWVNFAGDHGAKLVQAAVGEFPLENAFLDVREEALQAAEQTGAATVTDNVIANNDVHWQAFFNRGQGTGVRGQEQTGLKEADGSGKPSYGKRD
jgi:hypothetical protein